MLFLEPENVRLEQQPDHPPALLLKADRHDNVIIRQAFPLTAEKDYVAFFDEKDSYLGMIQRTGDLDAESKKIIESELQWRYFTPVIKRIIEIRDRGARALFITETDRGAAEIPMKDLRDSMVEPSPDRILINDEFGNRYEIPNVQLLDKHSRRLIRRLI